MRAVGRCALAVVASLAVAIASGCASLPLIGRGRTAWWGFTAPWDASSDSSLARHGSRLDAAVTGWFALDTVTGMPMAAYADRASAAGPAPRYAILTTSRAGVFHPAVVRALAADPALLARSAGAMARALAASRYQGLVLDFEELTASDVDGLVTVARAFADSARRGGGVREVAMAIPATDTGAYPARPLISAVDLVVVMLYDEHWAGSAPGAIASPVWASRALEMRVAEVGASRVVAGLPTYGYRWHDGAGEPISYADAVAIAAREARPLERDAASETLRAVGDAGRWELWVSDAGLVRRLADDAARAGVRRVALWRLGLEDPATWDVVGR